MPLQGNDFEDWKAYYPETQKQYGLLEPLSSDKSKSEENQIDVLFLIEPDLYKEFDFYQEIYEKLLLDVSRVNKSFVDSDINLSIRPVALWEWPFNERYFNSDSVLVKGSRLIKEALDSGAWDEVAPDMVVVLNHEDAKNADGNCGKAWINTVTPSFPSISVVDWVGSCASDWSTLAHEIGHNLGSVHHDSSRVGNTFDAKGHECDNKLTLMRGERRVEEHYFFSNPKIVENGEACGNLEQANNKKVFERTGPAVARYKSRVGARDLLKVDFDKTRWVEGEDFVLTLTRNEAINEASFRYALKTPSMASDELFADALDFLNRNQDFSNQVRFLPGEMQKEIRLTLTQDNVPEPEEEFTLSLFPLTAKGLELPQKDYRFTLVDSLDAIDVSFHLTRNILSEKDNGQASNMTKFIVMTSTPVLEDMTIVFEVSGSAVEGKDYELEPQTVEASKGTLLLRKNEIEASVNFTVLDDGLAEEIEDIVITVTQINYGLDSGLGAHSSGPNMFRLSVQDDELPIEVADSNSGGSFGILLLLVLFLVTLQKSTGHWPSRQK